MNPKNTARVSRATTPTRTPAQDRRDALEAARAEAREARAEAAATRSWAEATNAQLRAMQALTDTALSHLALDDLLPELLGRVTAVMGVDNVAISLLDEDDRTLTCGAARGTGGGDGRPGADPTGAGVRRPHRGGPGAPDRGRHVRLRPRGNVPPSCGSSCARWPACHCWWRTR